MMRYEEALQRIIIALKEGCETQKKDWEVVFDVLKGDSDVETILNVQDFVLKNFSFEIEPGAEGWAYLGISGATTSFADIPIFKYVDAIVEEKPYKYGYCLYERKWPFERLSDRLTG